MTLTAEYLRERLHYDPETGVFTWRPKDGSGKDDDRWNTRYADNARNASLRKDSTSGRKGVTWLKARSRWAAVIRVGGRQRCLGLFRDKEAAAAAYLVAAERHFGAFATDGV